MKKASKEHSGKSPEDKNNINMLLNSNYTRTINNKHSSRISLTNPDYLTSNLLAKKSVISQPTMRYKPRTDLERVYDVLNGYNYDKVSCDIIDRQLKSINLYDFKKIVRLTEKKKKEGNLSDQDYYLKVFVENLKRRRMPILYTK